MSEGKSREDEAIIDPLISNLVHLISCFKFAIQFPWEIRICYSARTSGNFLHVCARFAYEVTQRTKTWRTFRIFFIFFFCSGTGKGESEGTQRGGVDFLLKIPQGGGVSRRGRGVGRVSAANWGFWGGGGGGLNIFFRGRNVHQEEEKRRNPGKNYDPGGHLKKCRSSGQEKCRKSASESAGPKRGAEESAEKRCSGSRLLYYLYIGAEPGALFSALSSAPRFGPALSEALFRHFSWPGLRHFFRWPPGS